MRISDVLRALRPEFPGVSHSKLRFLEEQGLIEPVRGTSGYRQYSASDVERLRFVLVEQRDRYLPLKVIKDRLADLDAGTATAHPGPRLASTDESGEAATRFTRDSLISTTGASAELVESLVAAGVLKPSPAGYFETWSADVVVIAGSLAEYGIEARHLRSLRTAAERHVGLVHQVSAPWRGQQSGSSRAHAESVATEVGELLTRLHTTWVREGVADLTSS
ncbi:MerR family transcriptional regulator [Paraoerskovia sediminicola]|uniref:MerR family transcriptional regulator n=2 Tax=Paraoerskovia sediminicola TaxID=1138587 RepID=A0ABN6XFP7_9CELL|nr:MerR family transcriptional regulator [Paraoerskovia sediminicola]